MSLTICLLGMLALPSCGTDCDEGSCECAGDEACEPDPCADTECARGECDAETGECASKESCTLESEQDDCIAGERCLEGACLGEQAYCEALGCERGVCGFGARSCVNAADCDGDASCLDGYYCNDAGECAEDLCIGVDCTDGGVCVPSLGACENADSCAVGGDCVPGHLCVDGICRLEDNACGDPGCPGNQRCDYDTEELTATCLEADPCETSLDCLDDRFCGGAGCLEPTPCQPDRFEPNDSDDGATDFYRHASALAVDGSACAQDTDVFTIDTREVPNGGLRGELVVVAEYARRDAGVGELSLEIVDPAGQEVDSSTSGRHGRDGIVEVRAPVTAATQGVYTARLRDAGDVSTAGVHYTLSADLIEADVVSACADAAPIADGELVHDQIDSGASTGLGSGCSEVHSAYKEHIYTFELTEPSNVLIKAAPVGENSELDLSVSVRRSCERLVSEVACVNAFKIGEEVIEDVLMPGRYSIIVQPASGTTGGEFELSLSASSAVCAREQSSCVDRDNAEVCVEHSGFETRACEQGCHARTGQCFPGLADACEQAKPVSASFSETVEFSAFADRFEMPAGSCVPAPNGYTDTDGPDAVYAVSLDDGHSMLATLDSGDAARTSLYVVDGCSGTAASCVDGANTKAGGAERLAFINDTGFAKTIYLVADSAVGTTASAELDIEIGELVCAPNATSCNPDDDVVRCDIAGISQAISERCNYGCSSGRCNPPPNDRCATAVALGDGQSMTEPMGAFSDESDSDWQCVGSAYSGADAFYKVVTAEDDKVVSVEVSAPFDVAVYGLDSCSGASPCMRGTDEGIGNETLDFYAPTAGEYFIGVDTDDTSAAGDFSITVDILQPQCTPGEVLGCSVATAGTLEYCNHAGLIEEFACPSASCTGARCDHSTGDHCLEAVELTDGSTYGGSFSEVASRLTPPADDRCVLWDSPIGPDTVFSVDLLAGEVMRARLTTEARSPAMYVLEDCVQGVDRACLWGRSSVDELEYHAPEDGTYYLVVDEANMVTESFVLELDVRSGGVCQPGGAVCDASTGTLDHCDERGTQLRSPVQCSDGCTGQACNASSATNNTCSSAYALGGAARIVDSWARFANDYDTGGGCTTATAPGPEAVYSLDLAAGDVLSAELISFDPIDYPRLYLSTDCSDVNGSCLEGQSSSGEPVRVSWKADTDQTVYIFVDSDWHNASSDFLLDVDVQQSDCQAGDTRCADAATLETCTSDGIYEASPCDFGCTSQSCNDPQNDDCSGALSVPDDGSWHVYTGPIDAYTNDYDLSSAGTSCTGSGSPGPDALYAVDLNAGQVVEAKWAAPSSAAVWITDDCTTSPEDSCVEGVNSGSTPGRVTYTAPSDGTYFVVGDFYSSTNISGDFQMHIRAITPECNPGTTAATCVDQNTLEECASPGLYETSRCHFGCAGGMCTSQTNDTCSSAIDLGTGGFFPGDFADVSPDYDPTGGGCPGMPVEQRGPDATYTVTLQPNESIIAEVSSPSGNDVSVYIVTDCADVQNTCLVGSDSMVLSGKESVTYTAGSTQTVYVIVDAYGRNLSSGTYELDVTIQ